MLGNYAVICIDSHIRIGKCVVPEPGTYILFHQANRSGSMSHMHCLLCTVRTDPRIMHYLLCGGQLRQRRSMDELSSAKSIETKTPSDKTTSHVHAKY